MTISFDGRVAIVTGAGVGLGRSHALGLAARGAKVLVNDLGTATDGTGESSAAAQSVVEEIRAAGGEAMAHGANVTDAAQVQDMVDQAISTWGKIDILVCNAGILRDKTFAKMELPDFSSVVDVHLMGSVVPTKALWEHFRTQQYGRIVYTTSASGLYGNFGQANYGAAKAALIGLMNVLSQEGAKYDIRANLLAPTAATRMTEGLLPQQVLDLLRPETITPGLLTLLHEDAPSRMILGAGGGCFTETRIYETQGQAFADDELDPDTIWSRMDKIRAEPDQQVMPGAFAQTRKYAAMAAALRGIELEEK